MRVNDSHLDINILQDNSITKSLRFILIKNTYEQISEELLCMWENAGIAVCSVRTERGYIEKISQILFPEIKY